MKASQEPTAPAGNPHTRAASGRDGGAEVQVGYLLRCVLGGVLMGMANLVPGISGGTMLLASGVYPRFIHGVAELTSLRFRVPTFILLGTIGGAAASAIVLLAGLVKTLVVDERWVMYSLFIGLTLGGVPVVWRILRPMTASAGVGAAFGIAAMGAMAWVQPGAAGGGTGGETPYLLLLISGLAGASAMILPGISGGYLLLILGQYIRILDAIDSAKRGLLSPGGPNWDAVFGAMHVFVPLGLGVMVGIAGVSNLIRVLLARFEKATLGALLGLLLGAVLGLWPFQDGVRPAPGDVIKGRVMTAETIADLEPEDYPVRPFSPSGGQVAGALFLVGAGLLATQGIAAVGRSESRVGGGGRG